jgi:hypothetical protein
LKSGRESVSGQDQFLQDRLPRRPRRWENRKSRKKSHQGIETPPEEAVEAEAPVGTPDLHDSPENPFPRDDDAGRRSLIRLHDQGFPNPFPIDLNHPVDTEPVRGPQDDDVAQAEPGITMLDEEDVPFPD